MDAVAGAGAGGWITLPSHPTGGRGHKQSNFRRCVGMALARVVQRRNDAGGSRGHSIPRRGTGWVGWVGWLATRPPLVALPPAAKAGAPARNLSLVGSLGKRCRCKPRQAPGAVRLPGQGHGAAWRHGSTSAPTTALPRRRATTNDDERRRHPATATTRQTATANTRPPAREPPTRHPRDTSPPICCPRAPATHITSHHITAPPPPPPWRPPTRRSSSSSSTTSSSRCSSATARPPCPSRTRRRTAR